MYVLVRFFLCPFIFSASFSILAESVKHVPRSKSSVQLRDVTIIITSAEGHSSRYSENLFLFFRNTVSANQCRMAGPKMKNGCKASYHSEAGPMWRVVEGVWSECVVWSEGVSMWVVQVNVSIGLDMNKYLYIELRDGSECSVCRWCVYTCTCT